VLEKGGVGYIDMVWTTEIVAAHYSKIFKIGNGYHWFSEARKTLNTLDITGFTPVTITPISCIAIQVGEVWSFSTIHAFHSINPIQQ